MKPATSEAGCIDELAKAKQAGAGRVRVMCNRFSWLSSTGTRTMSRNQAERHGRPAVKAPPPSAMSQPEAPKTAIRELKVVSDAGGPPVTARA